MTKLRISDDLALPLDWILQATVVYGARGSGKTVFGSVLAEEAARNGQRFCAIDLKGDFYGLKSSADGKRAALPVIIFGGDHADVPLEDGAGAFIGETVAGLQQSCVLDLENFSKGKQVRFLAAFFASLYDHNRDPIMLLLDECQRYAPQKPIDPDAAKCLGAVEDLVKLGRKHGIGTVLTTQRGSGLNKEVSELCELLVAFRTPGPLDQERIKGWLDANTTKAERESVMAKLAGLPTGTAVFASGHPALKVFGVHQVRMRETFDSSATPKIGQRRSEPKVLAQPELEALRTKMAAAIERAKADDPKALRAELAAARKRIGELEKAPAPKAETVTTRVEPPALSAKDRAALERCVDQLDSLVEKGERTGAALVDAQHKQLNRLSTINKELSAQLNNAYGLALSLRAALAPPVALPSSVTMRPVAAPAQRSTVTVARRPTNGHAPAPAADLPKGELAVLTAAAQCGDAGATREQISILTGYKRSTRDAYVQRARERGYLDERGGNIVATADGIAALGSSFQPLPTGDALREHWLGRLPEGERKVLEVLCAQYPEVVDREAIGEATGYKRSTRDAYIQRLGTRKLISVEREGVTASAELFG